MKTRARSVRSTWIMTAVVVAVAIGLWLAGVIPVVAAIIVVAAAIGSSAIYTRRLQS